MELFNNECMPSAITIQCFAHLDQDVSAALPYLNAALVGFEYIKEPPSVTFRAQGKLITIYPRKVAINAIKDENEAKKIVEWIKREINDAWEKRDEIEPSYEGMPRPKVIEILKLLPKTNCKECGFPTCMVFATLAAEGAKDSSDCPALGDDSRRKLTEYMRPFQVGL
jgi:ArsR family metal-binding transcriptional regulator